DDQRFEAFGQMGTAYADFGNHYDLNGSSLTIEAWFNYIPGITQGTIVSKGNLTENAAGYSIFVDSGHLVVEVNSHNGFIDNVAAENLSISSITPGWHQVALVINHDSSGGPALPNDNIVGYLDGSNSNWAPGLDSNVTGNTLSLDTTGGGNNLSDFIIGA